MVLDGRDRDRSDRQRQPDAAVPAFLRPDVERGEDPLLHLRDDELSVRVPLDPIDPRTYCIVLGAHPVTLQALFSTECGEEYFYS